MIVPRCKLNEALTPSCGPGVRSNVFIKFSKKTTQQMTACNVEVGDIDAVGLMKIVITLQKGDHDRLKERDRHARLQVCSRDIDAHLTRDLSLVRVKAARVQYGGTHVLHQKVNISVIKVIVQKI